MSPIFGQNTLDFISHSEAQTRRLGARLAEFLEPGDVLALEGELGSGKTRWAQGVCQGLAVTDPVNSPTFTLVNEYQGRLPVYHIDLYRLDQATEVFTFGLEDYLYGAGVSLIEWADRAEDFLPDDYLTVELHHLEETKRRIVLRSHSQRFVTVLAAFKETAFAQHYTS
ncbi:MAG: tRNA (adenosine(37)-N6)-threonylcarbamoyltransferase complex ATPase subunit type 1 TsaE [Anaerolineae bacterium]|nr:tRNA (adenosine(37)-N6)-threonylcarbamoyltransferase complex ATPase subunit type 1 TsaE [Anaerolineae bacterium]